MAKFTKVIEEIVDCPRCETCQKCDASRVIKYGRSRKGNQVYRCSCCNRQFRNEGKSFGRRVSADRIGTAIDMFYDGLSVKRIAENLADIYEIPEPSKATIYEWVRDYTELAKREMGKHRAQTSPEWVADEMVLKVGGKKYWNWNVMDSETRYILASFLSPRRDARAATTVILKALNNATRPPKRIKTDRLGSYIDAIERVFGGSVQHVQSEGIRAQLNNNMSERLQGTFRERAKVMRGLQSLDSGQHFLDGWVINYNLFRPHESLGGRTPAEAARLDAPFKEWEDIADRDVRSVPQDFRRPFNPRRRRPTRDRSFGVAKGRF